MSRTTTPNRPLPSPMADTFSVERLIGYVRSGRIRIPPFQRGLKWTADDVVQLLDSMYRGYPVGALLFHKAAAPAATLTLGPLRIEAAETADAMHVVDGQQRIVSLAVTLGRPLPLPPPGADPYVVYFDPERQAFTQPPPDNQIPTTWAPLPALGDGSGVQDWLYTYPHRDDVPLRRRILDASTRLREYKLPAYIVEEATPDTLRDIFFRINKSGKSLSWEDVHSALYGRRDDTAPSTLSELSDALASLGFGTPDEALLLRCLIAWCGLDVTRTLAEHERRSPGFMAGATAEALPAIRQALDFLRRDALIPHLRLIPSSAVVPPLCRFFRLHPQAAPRDRALLRRVVWRFLLSGIDHRSFQRQSVNAIADNRATSDTVQALLRLVPTQQPSGFAAPSDFDARSRESRLAMLALASLEPRDLVSQQPVALTRILDHPDDHLGFRQIVAGTTSAPITCSAANRILLPGRGLARQELLAAAPTPLVLASHAIPTAAFEALRDGDTPTALALRAAALDDAIARFSARVAEWGASDRPALDHVLGGMA